MTESTSGLPVEGRADLCAICADGVDAAHDVGMFGVNAVLCVGCASIINRFTPRWWCLCLSEQTDIEIYQYGVRPDSPYFDAASIPTFVDLPSVSKNSPEAIWEFYDGLREDIRDVIWQMCVGTLPSRFGEVTGEALQHADVIDVHQAYREADAENVYVEARSYLPRPYVVSPNTVCADFSASNTDRETIERILSGSGEDEQESIAAFTTPGETDTTSDDDTSSTTDEANPEPTPTGQASLGGFQ